MIVDTHQHLIEPSRFKYAWLAETPELAGGHAASDYRRASGSDIKASVFMEVDVVEDNMEAEAAHFCEMANGQNKSGVVGVVAACRPGSPDFSDYLDRIAHPRLVGLRRILHVVADDESKAPDFRRNVASLGKRGLTFDLCVRADQLGLATDLVSECPDTQFILDHCGNPPLADPPGMRSWARAIARLSGYQQVACKVSGLVNHLAPGQDPIAALSPVVRHVGEVFGWNRLMFGGDWPVSKLAGYDLRDWTELAKELVSDRTQAEQEAFFSGNARRIYRLP